MQVTVWLSISWSQTSIRQQSSPPVRALHAEFALAKACSQAMSQASDPETVDC